MLERLDYVKIARGASSTRAAGRRGRRASERALIPARTSSRSICAGHAARAGFFERLLRRAPLPLCADLTRIPWQGEGIDLGVSNMALHWLNDPLAAFREWKRLLAPEGLLMSSARSARTR